MEQAVDYMCSFVKEFSSIKILDLGCGYGSISSDLYNLLPDKISKIDLVDNFPFQKPEKDFSLTHNSLSNYKTLGDFSIEEIDKQHMPSGAAIFYEQDLTLFLENTLENYDLIIFSNVLHFFNWEQQKQIILSSLTKLTDKGIIFVQIPNEKHSNDEKKVKYGYKHLLNKRDLKELNSIVKIVSKRELKFWYYLILKAKN